RVEIITNRINEEIVKIFPGDIGEITLTYAGLDIADDVRLAYADSTHFLGAPKLQQDHPFEVVIYGKSDGMINYHLAKSLQLPNGNNFGEFAAYCNGQD